MKVFVIGSLGYVGSSIDYWLRMFGHEVTGTARTIDGCRILEERGTHALLADILTPETLVPGVKAADVVIYCPRITPTLECKSAQQPWIYEGRALHKIAGAMAGTEKTFIFNSDTWLYGTSPEAITEESPLHPPEHLLQRPELELFTLRFCKIGIRAFVVRPGVVYGGRWGGGLPSMFVHSAHEHGAATIVGDGMNRWATIHQDDLGHLYALLLDRGAPGGIYNATSDDSFRMREIARCASRSAGGTGKTITINASWLGGQGECLVLDQTVISVRAQKLGWIASSPSILEELENGSYQFLLHSDDFFSRVAAAGVG